MLIQVMSDIHIYNWGVRMGINWFNRTFVEMTQTDAEVLVLAGDLVSLTPHDWLWSVARLKEFADRYKRVVYVPGNHEFYNTSIEDADLPLLAQQTGVDVLWPEHSVTIDGQRFVGGVMFQPKPLEGYDPEPDKISDHRFIDDFETEAEAEYHALRDYLSRSLTENDIVVTHHAPSNGSLASQWRGNPCNWWFITHQMQELIEAYQPKLWIHGHVHTPFDYRIGNTRVVCNPMGYPDEGVPFNPKLLIEVP